MAMDLILTIKNSAALAIHSIYITVIKQLHLVQLFLAGMCYLAFHALLLRLELGNVGSC